MTLNPAVDDIDLSEKDWREVMGILRAYVPEYAVWAFGSRVGGTAKAYSDLDLAVIAKEPLSLALMADLKEAFDESDLVFKVDVVDWATTGDSFRKIIENRKIVLQEGNSSNG